MRNSRPPQNDDFSICIACGRWMVFDDRVEGGMRKPTQTDFREIKRNPETAPLREAWDKLQHELGPLPPKKGRYWG